MGLLTALVGGALLGGAIAATRGDDKKTGTAPGPAGASGGSGIGNATKDLFARIREKKAAEAAAAQGASIGDTNPPDAIKDESINTASARTAAMRQRRRAIAGSAGRAQAPGGASRVRTGGAPRRLMGY